jgi:hypothetical protein
MKLKKNKKFDLTHFVRVTRMSPIFFFNCDWATPNFFKKKTDDVGIAKLNDALSDLSRFVVIIVVEKSRLRFL